MGYPQWRRGKLVVRAQRSVELTLLTKRHWLTGGLAYLQWPYAGNDCVERDQFMETQREEEWVSAASIQAILTSVRETY